MALQTVPLHHQVTPGDEAIVVYDDGTIDYYRVIETEPVPIIQSERDRDIYLELVRRGREWRIKDLPDNYSLILARPFAGRNEAACSASYHSYKMHCTPVWNVKIEPGHTEAYYLSLIAELVRCRDGRISHIQECSTTNRGHVGAVIKINRLIKRAEHQLEIEHARQYEDMETDIAETLRFWGRSENGHLTQKLANIPRPVLIEYLAENQECVDKWLLRLFGDLYGRDSCMLSAERCRLPTNHLHYLLLKIYEDTAVCLDLRDLLLARSSGVRAAYKSLGIPPLILK